MLEAGDKVRDYVLTRFLGQGSYGEVWLAEREIELADDCIPFALKFLINQSDPEGNSEGVRTEVSTWIRAGNHFNIVPVYDGFIYGRFLVIVSEYIDGGSLRDWLTANNKKAPSLEKAVHAMRGILRGLTHLHSRKIIHRDLKPENILLKDGVPKITDFGVSRMVETFSASSGLRQTQGAGAPLYMPPEAFSDCSPKPQLDTWSVGVIFYEMLSGEFPFNGDSLPALLGEITNREPRPLPPNVAELQDFVTKSLAKDVSQRFQTAEKMGEALEKAWVDMANSRKWQLETPHVDAQLEGNEGRPAAAAEDRQDGQDKDEERREQAAKRPREVSRVGDVTDLQDKQSGEASITEANHKHPAKVQGNAPLQSQFNKSAWFGVAVLTLLAIVGGIVGLSTKRIGTSPPNNAAFVSRGKECFEKSDYDCAIASFTKAIEASPESAEVYTSRGRAYFRKGDYDHAMLDFNKAIELKPQYGGVYEAYTFRAAVYGAKGNPDEAMKDLNRAIELNPQFPKAYFNRGIANREKGNLDLAIKDFDKAVELNPKDASTYYERGFTYKGTNRDQAIKDFDKAIELDSQSADSYDERGAAYLFEGNIDQAIKDLDKAIELNPKLALARYYRGLAYGNKGNHDQAMRDFTKAIELDPEMAEAYAYRGSSYSNKGDFDQALRDFNKAIELNPKLVEAYYNRGQTYGARGNHEQAMKDFSKAIELNPQYAPAYYGRSVAYKSLGQSAKAGADLQRYQELSKVRPKNWSGN